MVGETSPRILVVDDDEELRGMICNFLTFRGCCVETACDGVEGCAAFERGTFDMVITDIYMPRMNGLEFLDTIKQKDVDLPIIAMTGFPNADITEKVIEKGACDCMVKPFSLKHLITTIKKCFEQSASHKALSKTLSEN